MKNIETKKIVLGASLISFLFVVGGWFWAYATLRGVMGPIILHYDVSNGINSLGGFKEISEIGVFGAMVIILNGWMALELSRRGRFWAFLVSLSTLAFSILIFIGYGAIISVNY